MATCICQEKNPESEDQKPTLFFTLYQSCKPPSFLCLRSLSIASFLPCNQIVETARMRQLKIYSAVGSGAMPSDSVARTKSMARLSDSVTKHALENLIVILLKHNDNGLQAHEKRLTFLVSVYIVISLTIAAEQC